MRPIVRFGFDRGGNSERAMRRLAFLWVAAALAAPTAADAAGKAGRAALAPASSAGAAELHAHGHALVELDRVRGPLAAPLFLRHGGTLVAEQLQLWRVRTSALPRVLPVLRETGVLRSVHADRLIRVRRHGHITSGDPLVPSQWWLGAVGADRVEPPGPGRPVTVVDTGLDFTHPEFAARPNTIPLNPQASDPADTEDAHGTSVSSVIAAPANGQGLVGVYPQATLQVWDAESQTSTDAQSLSSLIQGIVAASSRGPGVINMSFGTPRPEPLLEAAILVAFGEGSLLVASSGNEFQQGNRLAFPANMPHVLTVAATNRENRATGFSSASLGVDLAAPGVEIPVAVPVAQNPASPYEVAAGTSFSAPIVSGAAAWVWTARPQLDNTQLFDLIRWSARDIEQRGFDPRTGFGLLDIPRALSLRAPPSDHQEPNDDVFYVRANGLFRQAAQPLTWHTHGRATLTARLDATEDPEDVYRVWVPARKAVIVRVVPNRNVDVELWRQATPSVRVRGAARRRHLIVGSYRTGARVDTVAATNIGRGGTFVYLDVFLPRRGPLDAAYALSVRTVTPPR